MKRQQYCSFSCFIVLVVKAQGVKNLKIIELELVQVRTKIVE